MVVIMYLYILIFFFFFSPLSGPCLPNPCHNGGICEISEAYRGDTFIGYVCKCPEGFNGIHCQHSKFHMVTFIVFIDRSFFYCLQCWGLISDLVFWIISVCGLYIMSKLIPLHTTTTTFGKWPYFQLAGWKSA